VAAGGGGRDEVGVVLVQAAAHRRQGDRQAAQRRVQPVDPDGDDAVPSAEWGEVVRDGATPLSAMPTEERSTESGRIHRRAVLSARNPKTGWISDEVMLAMSTITPVAV
jgi:hypothetical protein